MQYKIAFLLNAYTNTPAFWRLLFRTEQIVSLFIFFFFITAFFLMNFMHKVGIFLLNNGRKPIKERFKYVWEVFGIINISLPIIRTHGRMFGRFYIQFRCTGRFLFRSARTAIVWKRKHQDQRLHRRQLHSHARRQRNYPMYGCQRHTCILD